MRLWPIFCQCGNSLPLLRLIGSVSWAGAVFSKNLKSIRLGKVPSSPIEGFGGTRLARGLLELVGTQIQSAQHLRLNG